jgi:methyl-accepting chemotaxis protein
MSKKRNNLVEQIESISEQIQILALNIAVAAAKMSFNKKLAPDVNNKLSQLVNQTTLAVKNMNIVARAASSEKPKFDALNDDSRKLDRDTVDGIESSLQSILDDSRKILNMLNKVRQNSI